jgi:hypothetical protein
MISYLAAIVAFLAALIALTGETWDKMSPGKLKLTKAGRLAAGLAVLGFVVSLFMVHSSNGDARKASKQLQRTASSAENARQEVQFLEAKLQENGALLREYKSLLNVVLGDSERQPQYVMDEYVSLRRGETWHAPNTLYSGSLVRFYGFACTLVLSYKDREEYIQPVRYSSVPEVAVIGGSGESMAWGVRSASGEPCDGKIFVLSTPRIRSAVRSWREEAARAEFLNRLTPPIGRTAEPPLIGRAVQRPGE